MARLRHLVVVLGDQLDLGAAAFDGFDADVDAVWMAEVAEESTHVWSSKPRTALFLSAMRHFAAELQGAGRAPHYTRLDVRGNAGSLQAQLQADILRLRPSQLVMTSPGDWRVLQAIKSVAASNAGLQTSGRSFLRRQDIAGLLTSGRSFLRRQGLEAQAQVGAGVAHRRIRNQGAEFAERT
jgi:deoxyribodipyrimidine photolyase-like uncharacterized protein